jgi:ferredoxin
VVVLEKQVLKVKILNNNKQILANYGQNLLDLLRKEGYNIASYCGGTGQCGKCYVEVDGEKELSCSYKICKDISVKVFEEENIVAFSDIELADKYSGGELNLAKEKAQKVKDKQARKETNKQTRELEKAEEKAFIEREKQNYLKEMAEEKATREEKRTLKENMKAEKKKQKLERIELKKSMSKEEWKAYNSKKENSVEETDIE